jgi:hypothetical protein
VLGNSNQTASSHPGPEDDSLGAGMGTGARRSSLFSGGMGRHSTSGGRAPPAALRHTSSTATARSLLSRQATSGSVLDLGVGRGLGRAGTSGLIVDSMTHELLTALGPLAGGSGFVPPGHGPALMNPGAQSLTLEYKHSSRSIGYHKPSSSTLNR